MPRELFVAEMTRKPFAAAFELQRDNIGRAVIMSAARFWIDIDPADFKTVDCSRHAGTRSLGQIRTSSDPMHQHAIITPKPLLNEPVLWLRSPKIFGPKYPPMLAVQLMNPTAAAAAALVRNSDGNVKKAGK